MSIPVKCPYDFCRVRVTRPSSKSRVRVISNCFESSPSQIHDLVESSQSRATKTVESLQVIGLEARVNDETHEISHFLFLFLCYETAHDNLENGA